MRTMVLLVGAAALPVPLAAQESAPQQDVEIDPVALCPSEKSEQEPAKQKNRSIEVTVLHTPERVNPLRYDLSDGLIYAEVLVNGQAVRGIFDTGADRTFVDTGLIERLGGTLTETRSRGQTGSNVFDVRLACETSFTIPGQITLTGDLPATDLSGISEKLGRQVGVIIGSNILSRVSWMVNPDESVGILVPDGDLTFNSGEPDSVPVDNGRIEATINGKPATLLFDTGFNGSLALSPESWGDYISPDADIARQRAADATGAIQEKRATSGVSLSVGSITAEVEVSESKLVHQGVDGLLGYGFFSRMTFVSQPDEGVLYFSMPEDDGADGD